MVWCKIKTYRGRDIEVKKIRQIYKKKTCLSNWSISKYQIRTEPVSGKVKRLMLVCHTCCKCSMETTRNLVNYKHSKESQFGKRGFASSKPDGDIYLHFDFPVPHSFAKPIQMKYSMSFIQSCIDNIKHHDGGIHVYDATPALSKKRKLSKGLY